MKRSGLVLGLWCAFAAAGATAQSGREALRQGHEAYDFAEFDRAATLLPLGLDPGAGPRDSLWVSGLHKLIDVLLESRADTLAMVWARWAFRLEQNLSIDSVNFPPRVVNALTAAREFVSANPSPSTVEVQWRWPAQFPATSRGSLLMEPGAVTLRATVVGAGPLMPGAALTLPAGSHTLLAEGQGYIPVRAVVEVLPGVVTALRITPEEAARGYLYVSSRPWGTVLVNGERIGYTTIAGYRLAAGTYHVRIERPGYLPFDTTVTVSDRDQRIRLGNIRLVPERP
jgi:hypothetical protein